MNCHKTLMFQILHFFKNYPAFNQLPHPLLLFSSQRRGRGRKKQTLTTEFRDALSGPFLESFDANEAYIHYGENDATDLINMVSPEHLTRRERRLRNANRK